MHSHDRTMLASFAFGDPDKRNPLHDLACQYLATPDASLRLIRSVMASRLSKRVEIREEGYRGHSWIDPESFRVQRILSEHPISKGEGQYKTTIGFMDLILRFEYDVIFEGEKRIKDKDEIGTIPQTGWYDRNHVFVSEANTKADKALKHFWEGDKYVDKPYWGQTRKVESLSRLIAIEVKIAPVGIGDLVRQLNLYREYPLGVSVTPNYSVLVVNESNPVNWAAVVNYQLSDLDVEQLRREGIHPAFLGSNFADWLATRQQADSSDSSATNTGIEV